jgi:predicted RNase H-like nuclease (RuvC/YqgF family)
MKTYSRVISNQVRFGYGYAEIDGKLTYYAWHGYPNRNDDYITYSKINKKEFNQIEKEYPEEIEFMEKSIQKGVIKYNSKLGKVVKKVEEHLKAREFVPYEQRFHEKRAFNASKKEIERYNSYWESLKKYFNANFAPKYEL